MASETSTSTQLWAVDSEGAVYVLQDVGAWLSSVRSNEVLHGPAATPHADNWTTRDEVDGRFDRVVCGAGGLVCAKKNKILYIRRGVTYENPLGTTWTKALCDARELAVGRDCVVRRTSKGQLFVADSLDLSSTGSVFLPHWNSIPTSEPVDNMLALDSRDNLFLVSPSTGDVHVCPNLTSGPPEDFQWTKLIDGPPAVNNQSRSLLNILSWGKSNSTSNVFSSVTAGDSCLWCMGSSGRDVFQLVLDYGGNYGRKRKSRAGENSSANIRGSWKRFELPEIDEVTIITADWTELDVFCGVVKENRNIVSYAVLQENSGRVEISNPIGATQRWKSVSICAVSQSRPDTKSITNTEENALLGSANPLKSYPSIYPKLPPQEDFDICCEDGDCSFCRSANSSGSWLAGGGEESAISEEGGGEGMMVTGKSWEKERPSVSKKRKTRSSKIIEEKRGKKRKRGNGDLVGEEPISVLKIPRVQIVDQLSNVPFKLTSATHLLAQHQVFF